MVGNRSTQANISRHFFTLEKSNDSKVKRTFMMDDVYGRAKLLSKTCLKIALVLPAEITLCNLMRGQLIDRATEMAIKSKGLMMTQNSDFFGKKLSEAKTDLDLLNDTMSLKDNNGTDDTSPTFKLIEDGSDVLSREETSQLASRQEKFIKSLNDALIRIENRTYGVCRVTDKLISKERLRIVPHATLSIEAKRLQS